MLLYLRMLIMMVVSLYTSRVVLEVLGVTDYGIYNVVGGFVAMFSLLRCSLNAYIYVVCFSSFTIGCLMMYFRVYVGILYYEALDIDYLLKDSRLLQNLQCEYNNSLLRYAILR